MPKTPKVAVINTTPSTIIQDIHKVMKLAEYEDHLPKKLDTLLKINISWQHYYPACSTTPWQLDGVIQALSKDGYNNLIPAHNGTVVVDPVEGAFNNRHTAVENSHNLEAVYLDVAGDGPGPRAMRWHEKNVLIASADQVAIDAVAAKLMGLDPMNLKFIRLADEAGLGVGRIKDIEIVGNNITEENWQFSVHENTFASKGQKLIYWGPLKPIERFLLRSFLAPLAFIASNIYHNEYWLRFVGRKRIRAAMNTGWGKLFKQYQP